MCLEIFTALITWGPALNGTAFLGLQSHFGDKSLKFQVLCPQNGTAVLSGISGALTVLKNLRNKDRKALRNFENCFNTARIYENRQDGVFVSSAYEVPSTI